MALLSEDKNVKEPQPVGATAPSLTPSQPLIKPEDRERYEGVPKFEGENLSAAWAHAIHEESSFYNNVAIFFGIQGFLVSAAMAAMTAASPVVKFGGPVVAATMGIVAAREWWRIFCQIAAQLDVAERALEVGSDYYKWVSGEWEQGTYIFSRLKLRGVIRDSLNKRLARSLPRYAYGLWIIVLALTAAGACPFFGGAP